MNVKDYLVINEKTNHVLYEGNNAFRAHQAYFSGRNKIVPKGRIHQAIINYITALSERLN